MSDLPERPRATGVPFVDIAVAVAAICISVASLWVALRADRTQERLLAASVWPVLVFDTSDFVERTHVINLDVTNAGVGPAKIRWFDLYYRGKALANDAALLDACCERGGKLHGLRRVLYSEYMRYRVMVPHETLHFMSVPQDARNGREWATLDRERENVYVRACYCSVLDDCWLLDSRRPEPRTVEVCPAPDLPLYQG